MDQRKESTGGYIQDEKVGGYSGYNLQHFIFVSLQPPTAKQTEERLEMSIYNVKYSLFLAIALEGSFFLVLTGILLPE